MNVKEKKAVLETLAWLDYDLSFVPEEGTLKDLSRSHRIANKKFVALLRRCGITELSEFHGQIWRKRGWGG